MSRFSSACRVVRSSTLLFSTCAPTCQTSSCFWEQEYHLLDSKGPPALPGCRHELEDSWKSSSQSKNQISMTFRKCFAGCFRYQISRSSHWGIVSAPAFSWLSKIHRASTVFAYSESGLDKLRHPHSWRFGTCLISNQSPRTAVVQGYYPD